MAFEGHKGRKAKKGQEGQKNKYGSKCLELSNSARNAKIAKNFQKVPKAWRSMDIRPNGLLSWELHLYICKEHYVNFYPSQLVKYNF